MIRPLVMTCKTVPGYENPFWEVNYYNSSIVSLTRNQTLSNTNGSEIGTLTVTSSELTATVTIDTIQSVIFPDEFNGTYTCRVPNGNISSSVVLTNSKLYFV